MSTLLFLAILSSTFQIASPAKCRTNNDCKTGRCEWRRCVAKLERVASGRKEVAACYVDEDCNINKGQLCKNGLCVQRERALREYDRGDWKCFPDTCQQNFQCGFYKQCYDLKTTNEYAIDSFWHIPCLNEAPDFCAKAMGFPDAICRPYEDATKIFHMCQLPPPFEPNRLKSCTSKGICPRRQTCIVNTCYYFFWVTARKRCTNDTQCNFEAQCNKKSGQCVSPTPVTPPTTCVVNDQCNKSDFEKRVVRKVCERFECRSRRVLSTECAACKFDEQCTPRQECQLVLRPTDIDCDRGNLFYWYAAVFCTVKIKRNYDDAKADCKKRFPTGTLMSGLKDPRPDHGVEARLMNYFAIIDGWIHERSDGVEQKFIEWFFDGQQQNKSYYVCVIFLDSNLAMNNATKSRQRCQTSFVLRGNTCYLGGFTNFMKRLRIHIICGLMDSEMVRIRNKEEGRMVYGLAGGKSFWLGLKRERRDWYWEGSGYGYRARYFFWRTGQPDMSNSKNCVYSPSAGEWMTVDCDRFTAVRAYICQREPFKV